MSSSMAVNSNPSLSTVSVETPQHIAAMDIANTLNLSGFSAYFAGGWVRDMLAGRENDDIDIVTNASAKKIQQLFPKTSDEGLDYGIVFVEHHGEVFEVATFRKDGEYTNGRSPNSVAKGSMRDDALRRDFTVNALYYDPVDDQIHDYTNGVIDIDQRVIRSIGDPFARLEEDMLRILRAIRFSTKLEFDIEDQTMKAIKTLAPKIFPSLSKQKVWKELSKMSHYLNFDEGIMKMYDTGVLQIIFPSLKDVSRAQILESTAKMNALPEETPTIVKVLQLFPKATKSEALQLCTYLKLSKRDGMQIVKDYYEVKKLLDSPEIAMDYDWAVAYARHQGSLFIPKTEESRQRLIRLAPHIQRIQSRKPIVTSDILKSQGLEPSVLRGNFRKLLMEAEKISVNKNASNAAEVLPELKRSKFWPK